RDLGARLQQGHDNAVRLGVCGCFDDLDRCLHKGESALLVVVGNTRALAALRSTAYASRHELAPRHWPAELPPSGGPFVASLPPPSGRRARSAARSTTGAPATSRASTAVAFVSSEDSAPDATRAPSRSPTARSRATCAARSAANAARGLA